ncbi:RNA polymerase sigma factor [Sorangium sp. So ce861]|uniref:RNA polymerase sigma factor n=1 Tax=Sorangium sp. So ce861 TaxID=3133323 RepID=UPI003F5D60A4
MGRDDDRWDALARSAVGHGAVGEALKQVFIALRAGEWSLIRSEARRQGLAADRVFCEEVAQRVALDLWQTLSSGRFDEVDNPGGFVRVLVRRTISDLRKKDRRIELSADADEGPLAALADPAASLEDRAAFAEALRECLEAQSPSDRQVLWSHVVSPSAADAARQLGVPTGTFYVRLLRTRGRLKNCLESRGYAAEEQHHGRS